MQVRSHVHEKQEVATDLIALMDCLKEQTDLACKRKQRGEVGSVERHTELADEG